MVEKPKVLKTYMNYSEQVDPAHIMTMADLELSVALGTPLVTFNEERQPVAALAEKWTIQNPNKVVFTLRKGLLWSDGTKIVSKDYKAALDRAKAIYPNDLKSLFDVVDSISVTDELTLVFQTKGDVSKSGLLLKLTEPMYSLVAVNGTKLDLSKSSGAFVFKSQTPSQLTLSVNRNWYQYSKDIPEVVEIRKPAPGVDLVAAFPNEQWANLVSGSSLMKEDLLSEIHSKGFKTWQRSLDKVFSLYPSKQFIERNGSEVLKFVALSAEKNKFMEGMGGYTVADHFFPRGYVLWSPLKSAIDIKSKEPKIESLKIIIPQGPNAASFSSRITKLFKSVLNISASVSVVPLDEVNKRMKAGDYDLLATSIAVADPNFEGAMSFFFEREPAFINSDKPPYDFAHQLKNARGLPNETSRQDKMREIILAAENSGHVLPLFHFSSLAIAKDGIDLSSIPNTDETVIFSKVKIK